MTNKQRIKIINLLPDARITSTPRDGYTKIRIYGVIIKIDYCMIHGTGTGNVISMSTTNKDPLPETLEHLDQIIINAAIAYHDQLLEDCELLSKTIDEVSVDKPEHKS